MSSLLFLLLSSTLPIVLPPMRFDPSVFVTAGRISSASDPSLGTSLPYPAPNPLSPVAGVLTPHSHQLTGHHTRRCHHSPTESLVRSLTVSTTGFARERPSLVSGWRAGFSATSAQDPLVRHLGRGHRPFCPTVTFLTSTTLPITSLTLTGPESTQLLSDDQVLCLSNTRPQQNSLPCNAEVDLGAHVHRVGSTHRVLAVDPDRSRGS